MARKVTAKQRLSRKETQRIVVVSAHPDDAELALGASIACWGASGFEVFIVDLTNGEPTPFGTPSRRLREASRAGALLNIAGRRCLGFKNRELVDSNSARRALANVFRELRPNVVFSHCWEDVHPDHVAACAITEAARFTGKLSKAGLVGEPFFVPTMLYYPSIHVRLRALPSFVFDCSFGCEQKLQALKAYESQFLTNPANASLLARVKTDGEYWGNQINVRFGEPVYSRDPVKMLPTGLLNLS